MDVIYYNIIKIRKKYLRYADERFGITSELALSLIMLFSWLRLTK